MRNLNLKYASWLFLVVFLSFSLQIQAEVSTSSRRPLQAGMTLSQVAATWGTPADIVEYGIQGQVVWNYPALRNAPATSLKFEKGRLLVPAPKVLTIPDSESSENGEYAAKSDFKPGRAKSFSFMAVENQKILTDILKEVPSGTDSPGGQGASPAGGGQSSPAQIE